MFVHTRLLAIRFENVIFLMLKRFKTENVILITNKIMTFSSPELLAFLNIKIQIHIILEKNKYTVK